MNSKGNITRMLGIPVLHATETKLQSSHMGHLWCECDLTGVYTFIHLQGWRGVL